MEKMSYFCTQKWKAMMSSPALIDENIPILLAFLDSDFFLPYSLLGYSCIVK
jgi:hypothetical protein